MAWKAIGQEIRRVRVEKGISLGAEAQRLGIKASELNAMESGKKRPLLEPLK